MDKSKINEIGIECDQAIGSGDLTHIDILLESLLEWAKDNHNDNVSIAHVLYCIANLYAAKAKFSDESIAEWRNDKFPENNIAAINYLRKALSKINADSFPFNLLEIETNIANSLNSFCRVIEANHFWSFDYDLNLQNDANFVAPYARAKSLVWLSQFLNDPGHAEYYNFEAYKLLKSLYDNKDNILHDGIKNDLDNAPQISNFLKWGKDVEKHFKSYKDLSADIHYKDKKEELYREWCLENRFFLNTMNDITKERVAAKDILQFPNYVVNAGEGPFLSAAFSDIKNRFCKARYLAYCSLNCKAPEWLEKELYLTDTLDYVDFSTDTEYLKIAFRLCFSVLDSIATLMNNYFEIYDDNSSFSSRWIKQNLSHKHNPFIDALYWLSCDLTDIEKKKAWKAPNPNAACLRILRNDLEHNWIRVAEHPHSVWTGEHDYARTIRKDELEAITLEIFRYTRSAILYLTFAIQVNETQREPKGKTASFESPIYEAF